MDLKNLIRGEYLNDLLYVFSGGIANAWLSSEFSFWGDHVLFIDNYLIEGNSFLYILLYLSFVLGISFREIGYKFYSFLSHEKFNFFKLNKHNLSKLTKFLNMEITPDPDRIKYLLSREISRINAHYVVMGFFLISSITAIFYHRNWIFIVILFSLTANSIRCANDQLKRFK
jgi:hypothetical protein